VLALIVFVALDASPSAVTEAVSITRRVLFRVASAFAYATREIASSTDEAASVTLFIELAVCATAGPIADPALVRDAVTRCFDRAIGVAAYPFSRIAHILGAFVAVAAVLCSLALGHATAPTRAATSSCATRTTASSRATGTPAASGTATPAVDRGITASN